MCACTLASDGSIIYCDECYERIMNSVNEVVLAPSINLSEWGQSCKTAMENGEPPPALVITMRDQDGTISAELVIKRGYRLIVSPSDEYFSDGTVGVLFKLEPL